MIRSTTVSAPARLHFGLLRFDEQRGPSYGGLGCMIDAPRAIVKIEPADDWNSSGPHGQAVLAAARRAVDFWRSAGTPAAVRVHVLDAAQRHYGLGSGTQLALAVAAGVRHLCELPACGAEELATAAGRGARSAVGTHGFIRGGLIWEKGRDVDDRLGRLEARRLLPAKWRFVLVMPANHHAEGLYGTAEAAAFERLGGVPEATTRRLEQLAERQILPAAAQADLDEFGHGVYEFGLLAGECFASIQGGPFASPALAARVAALRSIGVAGVGQSSWGPTLFAVVGDGDEAKRLVDRIEQDPLFASCRFRIVAPDNKGAQVNGASYSSP